MTELTYLQNRTTYYSLFISELLDKSPYEIYKKIAPFFFAENDEMLEHLLKNGELSQLRSCTMIEVYRNYIYSFCTRQDYFGKKTYEMEALQLKHHALSIIEELRKTPTANVIAALGDNYEKNLSVIYALTLYCMNPDAKSAYVTILKKALRDADGLDACISLLYLNSDRKELLEILGRNKTVQCYPDVRDIIEQHYQAIP